MPETTNAASAPKFPDHPEPQIMKWSALEIGAIAEYGREMYRFGMASTLSTVGAAARQADLIKNIMRDVFESEIPEKWRTDKLEISEADLRLILERHLAAQPSPGAAEPTGWLPIETAPKDGTRVILCWGGKSINGYYLDNSKASTPWEGWRVESMVVQPPGKPNGWMPFPAPKE